MSNDNQDNAFQRRRSDPANRQAAPENRHSDWGHNQAGELGTAQAGSNANSNTNIGGVPGSQHNDWGHSAVPDQGSQQSAQASPHQAVMPGEEMGHLQDSQRPVGKPRS